MRALRLDFTAEPPLSLEEVDPPAQPPRGEWVRLRPILAGICGTDVSLLKFQSSLFLAPFVDLPGTLGHEILAEDEDGRRVVVDPILGCEALGREEWCPPCAGYQPQNCRRFGEDAGGVIGYADSVGGGWSEEPVVPRANVFAVPDTVDDERAVLFEPAGVALHAALLGPVRPPVLVVGAGIVGLATIAAVRALDPGAEVVALAKHEHQAAAAVLAGAAVIRPDDDGGHAEALSRASGARLAGPSLQQPTVAGGFPTVFECVGSTGSVDLALRFTAERGSCVLVGGSAYQDGLDLSPAWEGAPHPRLVLLRVRAVGG
ncbi:MAG TPA: alcohol dehydrogenase catalytic domain-containing protein [Actinomycetota bacterium]|nr:alcohol dehydrogenase catalytic domain-containing protein [Actinomycetota bacterium]